MLLQELGKPTDEIVILKFLRDIVKFILVNSKVISVFENGKVIKCFWNLKNIFSATGGF